MCFCLSTTPFRILVKTKAIAFKVVPLHNVSFSDQGTSPVYSWLSIIKSSHLYRLRMYAYKINKGKSTVFNCLFSWLNVCIFVKILQALGKRSRFSSGAAFAVLSINEVFD